MANDMSVHSLNAATAASRGEATSLVRKLQVIPFSQAAKDAGPNRADEKAASRPEKQDLEQSVKDLNHLVQELQRELNFSVDEASGEMVVKVVDRKTDEVVRQIPAEDVLKLRQRLEQATGALFSDKV